MNYFEDILVAISREEVSKVENLARHVEDIDKIDEHGFTLLHACLFKNMDESCKTLLEHKANPNIKSKSKIGFAPLHTAASKHNLEAVKLLIEHGAEVDIQDAYGNTPLSNAVFRYKNNRTTIDYLLKNGANPELKNFHDVSPRDLANDEGLEL